MYIDKSEIVDNAKKIVETYENNSKVLFDKMIKGFSSKLKWVVNYSFLTVEGKIRPVKLSEHIIDEVDVQYFKENYTELNNKIFNFYNDLYNNKEIKYIYIKDLIKIYTSEKIKISAYVFCDMDQ